MKKNARSFSLDRYTHFLFTLPAVILYSFFYIFAVIVGFYYSLTDWNGIDRTYGFAGLRNYRILFQNPRFWSSLGITIEYAILLVIGVVSIALILALCLNSIKRFKTFTKSIFFLPALISSIAIALIWDQMFYRVVPIIGQMLGISFLSQSPLANPKFALYAVLIVNIWQAVAIPTIIFLAGLQTIPQDLYEAGMIDGTSTFQSFRYITFPYLFPTLTVNMVLMIKAGITSFDYAFALTGGGPARSTELIGLLIYGDGFENMRFALANAEAVILFFIIAFFSYIQIKITNKGGINAA